MANIILDGRQLTGAAEFHRESRRAFGFPDFYGNNMSAWIDCLSGLRDDDGMSSVVLGPDEKLTITIDHAQAMRDHAPALLQLVEQCVADVNQRYVENSEAPALALMLR